MFVFSKSKFLDPSFLNPLNLWKSTTGVNPRKPPFCSTRGQSPRKPPSYTFLLAFSKSDFVLFFQKREVDPNLPSVEGSLLEKASKILFPFSKRDGLLLRLNPPPEG